MMVEKQKERETEQPSVEEPQSDLGDAAEHAAAEPEPESPLESESSDEDEPERTETEARLDALRGEFDELNDRHLRLAAEFDNYRKRTERQGRERRVRAQADLAGGLLEALDDLERVTGQEPDEAAAEAVLEGARLVEKKLRRALEEAGLEPVEADGEPFDPAIMEALTTVPTEDPEEDELVADVFQRGYRFQDLLVRPARVRVHRYEE